MEMKSFVAYAFLVLLSVTISPTAADFCECTDDTPICASNGQTYDSECIFNCKKTDDPSLEDVYIFKGGVCEEEGHRRRQQQLLAHKPDEVYNTRRKTFLPGMMMANMYPMMTQGQYAMAQPSPYGMMRPVANGIRGVGGVGGLGGVGYLGGVGGLGGVGVLGGVGGMGGLGGYNGLNGLNGINGFYVR